MPVTVTEYAARKIAEIIKDQDLSPDNVFLRVGVKGGGCSGFNYILDLTESKKDTDEVWEYAYDVPVVAADENGNGNVATATATEKFTLRVICDPKSYLYLNGTA